MAMRSSAEIAAKWSRNLSSSTQSIQAGVQATTVNPAQKAIERIPAYLAGVQAAVQSGKVQRGLQGVTLQSWQQAMINKGLPRIAAGATAAVPKMQKFMDAFGPHLQALDAKLQSMPRGDLNQNIQRMVTAAQHNAAFVYNK